MYECDLLFSVYKKVGGIGFKDFVQYRKLIIIQQYLLEQQVPMTEIANRVGIYDMKSFYNTFKRYFNQRPKTWREEACQREDSYRIEFQKDVLEKFIERHHINCYQETTTSRLYKHLLQVKQRSPLSLEGVEIILNLCKDMEEQFNSRYYVYEYLNDLIHEAYKSKAILHMLHPYQYLEDKEREQLFMNVIGFSVLKLGTGKTKTLKISLVVKDEIEFLQAYRLKQKIEQSVGNLNINIVMDMLI
ncbi:helix-turn-helix domain-containing protein [Zhenhengia yiwuensis]|uniref:helix-turn-helix domain-containing protein n=1 Tax=Zhenhengia yiwuensis TaxID=2763666 RepID=UPI002A760E13|nr:helix-turn-helix domain-containing protein [Zhenhengia yiwuensis]MDY3367000.1 helix-turn-helix domain-containing protein [Zhenhengia yiwuensis]